MLTNIHWAEAKKNFFFVKKDSKWPTQKNLLDVKGIHFAQPICSSGCPMQAQFTAKNAFLVFFVVN